MNENLHERAQRLLAESVVEGLRPADETWLREHLAGCPDCAHAAAATQSVLRALRAVPVNVPRDLAARTQLRVRLRAQESAAAASGSFWLWAVAAASWLLGVFSAPLVWRGFAWLGANFGVPKLALEFGFVLWWTVPPLLAAAIILHQKALTAEWSDKN
jgi:anti-sigma factor RsiW